MAGCVVERVPGFYLPSSGGEAPIPLPSDFDTRIIELVGQLIDMWLWAEVGQIQGVGEPLKVRDAAVYGRTFEGRAGSTVSIASASGQLNNKPAFVFDGTSDGLLETLWCPTTSYFCVFSIYITDAPAEMRFMGQSGNSGLTRSDFRIHQSSAEGQKISQSGTIKAITGAGNTAQNETDHIGWFSYNAADDTIRGGWDNVAAELEDTIPNAIDPINTVWRFGGSGSSANFFNGKLGSVLFLNQHLHGSTENDGIRAQLVSEIGDYYGVTVAGSVTSEAPAPAAALGEGVPEALAIDVGALGAFARRVTGERYLEDYRGIGGDYTDQTALENALANIGSDGATILLPGATIDIEAPFIVSTDKVTLRGAGKGTILRQAASVTPFQVMGSRSTSQGNTLASNATFGDRSVSLTTGKGANVAAGDVVLVCSEGAYTAANFQKKGEIQRVLSVSGDTVTFHSILTNSYTTADSAQIQKITTVKDFTIENLAVTSANPASYNQNFFGFIYTERFAARNVHAFGLRRAVFVPIGSIGGIIDRCTAYDLWSPDQGDANYLSYLVNETGANVGLRVIACFTERARHLYTADTTSVLPYGLPRGTRVVACVAKDSRGAGFGDHEECEDIGYIGCTADGSDGPGILLRGRRGFVQGGSIENSRACAIWMEKDAVDPKVSDVNIRNCGTFDDTATNGVDWREAGAIYAAAPGSRVTNCTIKDVGGPGISVTADTTNARISGNDIINPCLKAATNKYGIHSGATTTTTLDISDNRIRDDNGNMEYGVYVASSNQNAWISKNRIAGHSIAPIYGGVQNDNFHQIRTGSGVALSISSGTLDISLAGAGLIVLSGEGGANDDLNEIVGIGRRDGEEIMIRKGSGVISIKHNVAGPNGVVILTPTSADVSFASSTSVALFKRLSSTVWKLLWVAA